MGRYTLLAPLASGGMAEVWLARQQGLAGFEKLVVIKRMLGEIAGNEHFEAMFTAEARLAAAISHRHVVQMFELAREDGELFIAMEYVNGESLAKVLRTAYANLRPIPTPLAVQLVAWAAEGLHAAHTLVDVRGEPAGLIHRDVSPQNLIVTVDGSIKVVDFGVAKSATEHTVSGKIKGKVGYLAPEQARTERLDARVDVFALGVVLFELLTQTRLYYKLDDVQILTLLLNKTPLPRCRERVPTIDEELDDIVARAMAHDREQRHGSAGELQSDLEGWLKRRRLSPSSTEIAAFLREVFPNRETERRQLLEGMQESGSRPETGASPSLGLPLASRPARRWPWALAAGALLVLSVLVASSLSRPTERAARFTFEATPQAAITIDRRTVGTTPLAVELAPGPHDIEASASGCVSQRRGVVASEAGGQSLMVFQLQCPIDAGALKADIAAVPDLVDEPAEPLVDAGAPAPPTTRARGRLDLMTTPYTEVYLGKRRLGATPLRGVALPAGDHVLRLENLEAGVSSVIEVTIKPNQTTRETLTLR